MQHTFQTEGFGTRLRPVRLEDAAFIVWIRNLEHAKGRVGDSAESAANQETWLKEYFRREGDYYFIVETVGRIAVGTYGIYDVAHGSGESGRYIMRPGVTTAIPCAILGFDLAFGPMGLKQLRGKVVSTNNISLSLSRKFGFKETGIERGGQVIGGKAVDMIHFIFEREVWLKSREKFLPLARLAEKEIIAWEKSQQPQTAH